MKLTKAEQAILNTVDRSKYQVFRCPRHGIYAIKKGRMRTCPYGCGYLGGEEYGS